MSALEIYDTPRESIPLIPQKKGIVDEEEQILQQGDLEFSQLFRGETIYKWWILAWLTTIWLSTYHCIFSIGALEYSIMNAFNLSSSEFSLLSSLVFGVAIISALICPTSIKKFGLYNTLIIGQSALTVGQFIFFTGVYISSVPLMFFGRAIVGTALGVDDVAVNCLLGLWFGRTRWSSLAFLILSTGLETGIFTCRYSLIPIKEAFDDDLSYPFLLGTILAILSVIAACIMRNLENTFINHENTPIIVRNTDNTHFDHNFKNITQFSLQIWLLIIFIGIGFGNVETFATQMTYPFIDKFGVSEWTADYILSLTSIMTIILGPIFGYIVGKYGRISYFLVSSMILMLVSCLWLGLVSSNQTFTPWICTIIFVVGSVLYFTSFSSLFMLCPITLISLANAVNTFIYLGGGMVETYIFGVIRDTTGMWDDSILMLAGTSLAGLIISIVIFIQDIKNDGPLHKGF